MRVKLDDAGRVTGLEQAVEACAFGQAAAALMGSRAIGLGPGRSADALARSRALAGGR